jgi:hypothetical protein
MKKEIINLGKLIDKAFDTENRTLLEIIINKSETIRAMSLGNDEIAVLDYFIGNAWSDLDILRNYNERNVWGYDRAEHINAIKYFRKCVSNTKASDKIKKNIFIQAYTNIGNMFSESGRIIYAVESWNRALNIFPSFGMAGANLSHGLIYYAQNLYDSNHRALFLRHAHNLLTLYLKCPDIHEKARIAFETDLEWIKKTLTEEFLKKGNDFREFSLGRSKNERKYRTWSLKNTLYLNPLNDIFHNSAITHDVLHLPNMLIRDYKAPVFHGFFNGIKQEYITARFLYFSYKELIPEHPIHYSDNGRNLINTLDYPQYGYGLELLKSSFRILYSIFDKIAYFINEYFKIGIDRTKVSFRGIWYLKDKINPVFEQLNNNPLRGLFYLSKDFYSKDMEYLDVADPDAKDMADIRNNLEHKYLKIHWIKTDKDDEIRFDNLAYSILESDFSEKSFRLLRCAREAIIYLSLAIHVEERRTRTNDGFIMPLTITRYD